MSVVLNSVFSEVHMFEAIEKYRAGDFSALLQKLESHTAFLKQQNYGR
jgi:hypothetical protein